MNRLTLATMRRFVPIVKTLVAIVVVFGLFVAIRSSVSQWKEQDFQD